MPGFLSLRTICSPALDLTGGVGFDSIPEDVKKSQMAEAPPNPKAPALKSASGRSAKAMRVSSILSESLILIPPPGTEKNQLIELLVSKLCEKTGQKDVAGILAKVQDREQGISTTLDTGLSLPHVRLDNLPSIVAAIALVDPGLPDPKQPDLVIRVMFLFFSPNKPESFPLHLQLLRGVSSLFQPSLIDQLVKSSSPAVALELIRKSEG